MKNGWFWQEVSHEPVSFGDLLARPGVVETLDRRSKLGFCAFHGGNLERFTDQIAREAAERSGSSFYGVLQPKGMRQHIPSTKVDPAESEKLQAFLDHCDMVIAIHGYGLRGRWTDLLVGGQNRELAHHVSWHVRRTLPQYRVVEDVEQIPKGLRGQHSKNPCNLARGGGVQIELPPRVRGLTPMALHWPGHDPSIDRFPHIERLIEGLATAASTWSLDPATPPASPRPPVAASHA